VYTVNTGEYTTGTLEYNQAPTAPEVSGFKVNVEGNEVNLEFTLVGSGTYEVLYTIVQNRPPYNYYTAVETIAAGAPVKKTFSLTFVPDRVYIIVIGGKARGWPPFWAEIPALFGTNVIPIEIKTREPVGVKVSVLPGYAFPPTVAPAKVFGTTSSGNVKVILEVIG